MATQQVPPIVTIKDLKAKAKRANSDRFEELSHTSAPGDVTQANQTKPAELCQTQPLCQTAKKGPTEAAYTKKLHQTVPIQTKERESETLKQAKEKLIATLSQTVLVQSKEGPTEAACTRQLCQTETDGSDCQSQTVSSEDGVQNASDINISEQSQSRPPRSIECKGESV